MKTIRTLGATATFLVINAIFISEMTYSQVIGDGTRSTAVEKNENTFEITGGTQSGENLFHSFREFSIPNGFVVNFVNNNITVSNVFSRVTGSSVSEIMGEIRAGGMAPDFNLFLLNPNGIIFGENASLNLNGSFLATTAKQINFADGSQFSAVNSETNNVLTVTAPMGVQFGNVAQDIVIQNTALSVPAGNSLHLLGGNIELTNSTLGNTVLDALQTGVEKGTSITLGGIAEPGVINLTINEGDISVSIPDSTLNRSDVLLQESSTIGVSGNQSGDVNIFADSLALLEGSRLESVTFSSGNNGRITIDVKNDLLISGGTIASGILSPEGGDGTDIDIEAGSLVLSDRGGISSSTFNLGQGGDMLSGGNAGDISVRVADSLTLRQGSLIRSIVRDNTFGKGGEVTIDAQSLSLFGGSQIASSVFTGNPGGQGDGGNLTINVSEQVILSGVDSELGFSTALLTVTERGAVGQAGEIDLNTSFLQVADGAIISAQTENQSNAGIITINADIVELLNGGQLQTSTRAQGNAGGITLDVADRITISGVDPKFTQRLEQFGADAFFGNTGAASGLFADAGTNATGNGGSIVANTNRLEVLNSGNVSVSSLGTGEAGNLEVNADAILLENQGSLVAETQGGQGNISFTSDDIRLLNNSSISTNAQGEAGGGNITIETDTLAALDNSDITANAEQGSGGQVRITAQGVFGTEFREEPTEQSDITASSELGSQFSGVVEISTPDVDPSQGLVQLPENVVDVATLIEQGCAVANASSFTVVGKGGLPPSPSDNLSSDSLWVDLGEQLAQSTTSQFRPSSTTTDHSSLVEAQGWIKGENGNVILTANPQQVNPQSSWQPLQNCSPSGS